MQYKNYDEWIFLKACDEAMRACGTLAAQVIFVKSKLERVSAARVAKAKANATESYSLFDKHRATHYGVGLPFEILEDEVRYAVEFLDGLSEQERLFMLQSPGGEE